jgi:hypothetical protein
VIKRGFIILVAVDIMESLKKKKLVLCLENGVNIKEDVTT